MRGVGRSLGLTGVTNINPLNIEYEPHRSDLICRTRITPGRYTYTSPVPSSSNHRHIPPNASCKCITSSWWVAFRWRIGDRTTSLSKRVHLKVEFERSIWIAIWARNIWNCFFVFFCFFSLGFRSHSRANSLRTPPREQHQERGAYELNSYFKWAPADDWQWLAVAPRVSLSLTVHCVWHWQTAIPLWLTVTQWEWFSLLCSLITNY